VPLPSSPIRRSWPLLAGLLLLLLGATPPARAADDPPTTDREAGLALLKRGDALADEGKTTDAVLRYKEAYEKLLPGLRSLPFKGEVKRDVTRREAMKDFLIKEIDLDMTPAEFRASELGMKALGFLPRDMDFKGVLVQVYSEEIAAFYDPRTKTMHLIEEPAAKAKKAPSFLERLMGRTGGFDKEENKTVIAHELTHALADQHYDLKAMQDAVKGDDDRDLALSALIEGEATLAMMGAQMGDWEGKEVAKLPAKELDQVFSMLGPVLPMMGGGPSLKSAPAILRESLLFPYLKGLVFCAHLANADGWASVDAAYRNPPESTEQILHPEKYQGDAADRPMRIALKTLDAGPDWKEVGQNVVGEMQLAILLRDEGGRRAAAGWDGDRFAVFEGPDGKLGLVWRTTWDTDDDAREFATSYTRFQTTKLERGAVEPKDVPDTLTRDRDGATFTVERRGKDVAIVEGFPKETTQTLLDAAFAAEAAERAAPKRD
jgi:hypothetical protein